MQRQDTHSKLIGYLLWIFGFLGSHRFYYGRPVTGTIWFFTLGLLFIGWIIDLFLIPSMDREADESMQLVLKALDSWRYARTNLKLPPQRKIKRIDLDVPPDVRSKLQVIGPTLRAALRCQQVEFGPGELETGHHGWRLAFVPGEGDGGRPADP